MIIEVMRTGLRTIEYTAMTIWNGVKKANQREEIMIRISLVTAVAVGLAVAPSASALAAKSKQPSVTQARVQRTHQWTTKCAVTCREYGWPSYLLSFPPPR